MATITGSKERAGTARETARAAERGRTRLRRHVVKAVFKRNVQSYFSGLLGYLFIIVFVVAAALLAFRPEFFTNNLANLDQLSQWFPMLLLFIVPAITMSTWADEKKLKTDELLFTLPASDIEILLGKYFSVLAVYTIVLAFSLPLVAVLGWIGDPDWGLIFTTYLGYWVSGAALLSAGMFASVLTNSTTVAFVLGVAICAIPVFLGQLGEVTVWGDFLRTLSLEEQLRDFTMGIIPLSSVLYFVALAAFMLYLNMVLISKRHWSGGERTNMGLQFAVRAVSLAVILGSAWFLSTQTAYGSLRVDMTAENLYTLSPTTSQLIETIDENRPVTISAFVSPDVPQDYVPVRKRMVGLLRQFDRMGGSLLEVRHVAVEPYSEEAEEAKAFGIEPEQVMTERNGRRIEENIYLGAVVSSPYDEVVIEFMGPGTPVEYELTRSVHTVSNEERLTVGVLRTDADVIGGGRNWQIVEELKKQYNVEEVSPDSEIEGGQYDVLMAVMPSSLTQPQMQNLVNYVKAGHPTLIFDDPFPWVFNSGFGVTQAPKLPKPSPGGGMMGMRQRQQAPPKASGGRATSLLNALDIAWQYDEVVFDLYNPHPEFKDVVPQEFLFIAPRKEMPSAISPESRITSGLQEILAAFSGTVRPRADNAYDFQPLLRTGPNSGLLGWEEFTQQGFDPSSMSPAARPAQNPPRIMDRDAHVIAAHITSDGENKRNVVFAADLDMISDWFFVERDRAQTDLRLDNVTFALNAVDVLAGDESYLALRKRRPRHRTLEAVEAITSRFIKEQNKLRQKAEDEAKEKLQEAKERFEKQRQKIQNNENLDQRTKQVMLRNIAETEERRIDVAEANIERDKQDEIEEIKAETQRKIRSVESQFRLWAVLFSPIPAVAVGLIVLSYRLTSERKDIAPERLRK